MSTKEKIIEILNTVEREGISELIAFLEESTFFSEPAHEMEYNAYEGGLADHSLSTYNILKSYEKLDPEIKKYSESITIIGLLHDVSLIGAFQRNTKNLPLKGKDGKNVKNEYGKLLFTEKEVFEYSPQLFLPYPHGQLSTQTLKKYIKLTKLEDLAILWHHGDSYQNSLVKHAQKMSKIIFWTYCANKEASLYHGHKIEEV